MEQINQTNKEVLALESIFDYIKRIKKNREIIEKYYFLNEYTEMQKEIYHLFEGIVWIEYALIEMQIPFEKEKKDQLFNGVGEAIEINDWLTVIDFISYGLLIYLQLIENSITIKYNSIIGGSQ